MLTIEYRDALQAMKDQAVAATVDADTHDQRRTYRKKLRDARFRMSLHARECAEISRLLLASSVNALTIETLTVEGLEEELTRAADQAFRIFHHYDVGNQAVYIRRQSGSADVRRAAAYIQTMAGKWFGVNADLGNLAIASALVAFYGCQHWSETSLCQQIDMYSVRSSLFDRSDQIGLDTMLQREGLREYIARHVDASRTVRSTVQGGGVVHKNMAS